MRPDGGWRLKFVTAFLNMPEGLLTIDTTKTLQDKAAYAILMAVLEYPSEQRTRYLDRSCVRGAVRRKIDALLAEDDTFAKAFDDPLFDLLEGAGERAVNQRIGPYRILRELGEGGMGTVYLGTDDKIGSRPVAIKILRPGTATVELIRRFEAEGRLQATLRHPGIVQVHEISTIDAERPYFVMEYVDGKPVTSHCRTLGLSIRDRLELFSKICETVHFAHQQHVVHRDLKPENILVTPSGEAKLLDFGVAKILDRMTLSQTSLTERRLTPAYASPELLLGAPTTAVSDVYSLGVLLYELLTGQRPRRVTLRSLGNLHRQRRPPLKPSVAVRWRPQAFSPAVDPESLSRRLAGDLDHIALKAVSWEPRRRYRSALALDEDVRRHLAGRRVGFGGGVRRIFQALLQG
jgi:serine/threonine protein kinase